LRTGANSGECDAHDEIERVKDMENRDIQNLIDSNDSVFSLVIAVAKRSRDIAEKAQEDRAELNDKPVNIALREIMNGKIRVVD